MTLRLRIISLIAAIPLAWTATAQPTTAEAGKPDESGPADFVARGNEPGWHLRLSAEAIVFTPMDGTPVTVTPPPPVRDVEGVQVYETSIDGSAFKLSIAGKLCVDSMSGMPHPASVEVLIAGKTLAGCGGDPAALLHGEWFVAEIGGKSVMKDSIVTLEFGADGHLSGAASCNRFFSGYALTGEGLRIESAGVSMMMCEPAELMAQEAHFLATLAKVERFEIGADGSLSLITADAGAIIARRKA